ncbi:MAG TPA: phospholipase D-like domain-containing protein [Solirubrobacteraceae bacterium]|nr:phospholipase D-like domain-containing protein [Solirubrobacteraceae bacterium]
MTLITEPRDGIAPVLSAIEDARRKVDMVMYEDDDGQVNAALAADVHRGVSVRVLLNGGYYGQGSPENQPAYNYLKRHGVPVRWTPSYFALTHQKTLIVDGRAYILTFNLTPQYYASSRDFGVIDTIPTDVAAIERTFNADWNGRRIPAQPGDDLVWSPGSQGALVALIGSASGWVDVYNEEMDSPAIETALARDARRGVDVRVTMTADSSWDSAFTLLASAGVHVRTYAADAPLYIHAKMILTPAEAFIGSQNFSAESMNDNRELGIITSDPIIRVSLARTFGADYAQATPYPSAEGVGTGAGSGAGGGSSMSAECSVTASYSSRYDDWDVYVHSNQPDATATVTGSAGATGSYHTDAAGYADIYLKAPASAAGQSISVHVGEATCIGTL